ncbi:MAG: hypothetical protein HYY65_05505 [Candidatus Tectomicrobia bacterium]|uniref:Uncharacterized protein n=1 Tax=Tectimicrobiota bacterium TaxID=2528274 RepID=A0A932LZV4_UNCTE|nr:hypothetical protein [Candidatus Tectomicrobia bacterium]
MNHKVSAILAKRRRLAGFLLLVVLLAICFLNRWIFRELFGLDYVRWYVDAGPIIALATAAFGAAWGELDKNPSLVSANPYDFAGACLQVAGLPIDVFGAHLRSKNREVPLSALEFLAGLPLIVVFVIAAIGWLLFVVPLQYFVFLICGAPSRIAMASSIRVEARIVGRKLEMEEQPLLNLERDDWWDASMRDKPVTLTSAFSAAALFLISQVWGYWAAS